MSIKTKIQWSDATWNPTTGCDKVSVGCKFCYAEILAEDLQRVGSTKYKKGFELVLHPEVLKLPLKWKKPRKIFVNSMSDLFHRDVPEEFIYSIFEVMNEAFWHTFMILTKRPERLEKLSPRLKWAPNIWMGVTVENQDYVYRIDTLRVISAHIKFVSFEPLLAPITKLDLAGIDWTIVGGESGPNHRSMDVNWARDIRDQAKSAGLPFFYKQGSGFKQGNNLVLDGRTWEEFPAITLDADEKRGNR